MKLRFQRRKRHNVVLEFSTVPWFYHAKAYIIQDIKNKVFTMATPEVEQYIKNELARGTSRSEIESNLLQNGWNDDEVARGFRAVETSERDKAHQEEAPSPSLPHSGPDSVPGESVSPEPGTPGDSSGFPGPFALLRESFRYVAGRFWTLVGILLIFFVIGFIAQLAIQFFYGISFAVLFGFAGDSSENVGGVLMAIVALVSVLGLAASVFIRYWSTGSFLAGLQSRHPSIGDAIKRGAGLAWPLFVLGVFSALVILGASIPFIIPAFLFLVWFSLAYYIAVEEDKRGFAALVRSREYMRERTFGVLGRTLFLLCPPLLPSSLAP
ncbi:MAG: hypothetical protein U5L75_02930 [Candidatus Campbellbacteria bacterium]|nr:hypothetical protein [Candidatus Campbellbacteria bacterium]